MHTMVVGGQYGSEGKGAFCKWLLDQGGYTACIRAGGPQAGHTVLREGEPLAFTTLPVSVASGQQVEHIIGPATVVDPARLALELDWVPDAKVAVDFRSTVLTPEYKHDETNASLVSRLGSTGKGVGAARAARVMRTAVTAGDWEMWHERVEICDTVPRIRDHWKGGRVLGEGAQGLGLSLFTGGHYPYATSSECTAIQMLSDIGIDLKTLRGTEWETVGVYRTFPIRTGGNSGPLYRETTWEELQQRYGDHIPVEKTTVTQRIRRVGEWDGALARWSAYMGGVDRAALTFVDYIHPGGYNPDTIRPLVETCGRDLGVPIGWVSVGFGEVYEWQ